VKRLAQRLWNEPVLVVAVALAVWNALEGGDWRGWVSAGLVALLRQLVSPAYPTPEPKDASDL